MAKLTISTKQDLSFKAAKINIFTLTLDHMSICICVSRGDALTLKFLFSVSFSSTLLSWFTVMLWAAAGSCFHHQGSDWLWKWLKEILSVCHHFSFKTRLINQMWTWAGPLGQLAERKIPRNSRLVCRHNMSFSTEAINSHGSNKLLRWGGGGLYFLMSTAKFILLSWENHNLLFRDNT